MGALNLMEPNMGNASPYPGVVRSPHLDGVQGAVEVHDVQGDERVLLAGLGAGQEKGGRARAGSRFVLRLRRLCRRKVKVKRSEAGFTLG